MPNDEPKGLVLNTAPDGVSYITLKCEASLHVDGRAQVTMQRDDGQIVTFAAQVYEHPTAERMSRDPDTLIAYFGTVLQRMMLQRVIELQTARRWCP